MVTTYFGFCNADGTPLAGSTDSNNDDTIVFWCDATAPGSGVLDIVEFNFMGHRRDAGNATCRMAVYDSTGNTLLQQSTTFLVTNGSPDAWQAGDTTIYPRVLVGGTAYKTAWTVGAAAGASTTHGDLIGPPQSPLFRAGTEYTGGFPASLPGSTGSGAMYSIRIGTQPSLTEFTADQGKLISSAGYLQRTRLLAT